MQRGRPSKGIETSAVIVRFPVELLARIDAYKDTLSAQVGGIPLPRTEVIFRLCRHALDQVEGSRVTPTEPPHTVIRPREAEAPRTTPHAPQEETSVGETAPSGELPEHIRQVAELREQYPRLSLRDFAKELYKRGIRTKTEKEINAGTLTRWLERAGMV